MSITNSIDRLPSKKVAEVVFAEILSSMGGYALLEQVLGIRPCYLCRGMEGELIMSFDGCNRCNKVRIQPDEVNWYKVTFYRFSIALVNRGCQVVGTFRDISRDSLQQIFEEFTGLSLMPQLAST
jgi:hypothetical protein